ncbi:MAG: hypothetical protein ACREM2_06520 [Vulcanimicrobiaceae bacterium]
MTRFALPAVLAALLVSATALPGLALTIPAQTKTTTFTVSFSPQYEVGSYDGTLRLTIGADGIVNGFYRPDDGFGLREVTGGLDGDHIWIDFGSGGVVPRARDVIVEGTYNGTTISGMTFAGGKSYLVSAEPTTPGL